VFWLQKPSILRACVREEDAGGREAGAPSDLKMPLENGRADERVSRGQAGGRRRLRLAITASRVTPSGLGTDFWYKCQKLQIHASHCSNEQLSAHGCL
jgi:hypothetical protein